MRMMVDDCDSRTVWCGNLPEDVSEELLYELFNQAGPVQSIRRPQDPSGRPKSFAFIVYKYECSVPYALEVFRGTKLFNRMLNINSRSLLEHVAVLDTNVTEFTDSRGFMCNQMPIPRENVSVSYHDRRSNDHHRRGRRDDGKKRERDPNEPQSWAELNALRGKGHLTNGNQGGLQGTSEYSRETNPSPAMPDFNMLLQMGQQMMLPGIMGMMPGMMGPMGMMSMPGMGPGGNMFHSLQGRQSVGERQMSPERDRSRRESYDRRDSRRDHPYQDRRDDNRRGDNRHNDQRRYDSGYSSSQSSHDRERRDRRSR